MRALVRPARMRGGRVGTCVVERFVVVSVLDSELAYMCIELYIRGLVRVGDRGCEMVMVCIHCDSFTESYDNLF